MGDDIGMWNIGAYHRGMMARKTPNLDKIAKEGMLFVEKVTKEPNERTENHENSTHLKLSRRLSC